LNPLIKVAAEAETNYWKRCSNHQDFWCGCGWIDNFGHSLFEWMTCSFGKPCLWQYFRFWGTNYFVLIIKEVKPMRFISRASQSKRCSNLNGVLGTLPGMIGTMMAHEQINYGFTYSEKWIGFVSHFRLEFYQVAILVVCSNTLSTEKIRVFTPDGRGKLDWKTIFRDSKERDRQEAPLMALK
jgi:hypothetical protein